MIRTAQLYKDKLAEEHLKTWYNPEYIFYDYGWNDVINLPDNNFEKRCFVSVDKNDNILGYISYRVDENIRQATDLAAICYKRPSIKFVNDLQQVIDDIFNVYNLNRLTWSCCADNPALRGYSKFIKRYGGKEAGYYRETVRTRDGKLRDTVVFEILKKEYKAGKQE